MAKTNTFMTEAILTGTSTGQGFDFGFSASALKLVNDGPVPVRFDLESSAPTTDGCRLGPGEPFLSAIPPTNVMSLNTTSTTSSTGLDAILVRVAAFGG